MTFENDYSGMEYNRNLHEKCKLYLYHHVSFKMTDGRSFDGIIEDVSGDSMTVLVGEDVKDREDDESIDRQYYGYDYGRPRRRYRRFRRQILPLAALATLSLLPYALPYPTYPPYYPYYPYY